MKVSRRWKYAGNNCRRTHAIDHGYAEKIKSSVQTYTCSHLFRQSLTLALGGTLQSFSVCIHRCGPFCLSACVAHVVFHPTNARRKVTRYRTNRRLDQCKNEILLGMLRAQIWSHTACVYVCERPCQRTQPIFLSGPSSRLSQSLKLVQCPGPCNKKKYEPLHNGCAIFVPVTGTTWIQVDPGVCGRLGELGRRTGRSGEKRDPGRDGVGQCTLETMIRIQNGPVITQRLQ